MGSALGPETLGWLAHAPSLVTIGPIGLPLESPPSCPRPVSKTTDLTSWLPLDRKVPAPAPHHSSALCRASPFSPLRPTWDLTAYTLCGSVGSPELSCSISKRLVLLSAQRKLVFQPARSGPSGTGWSSEPLLGGHLPRARAQAWERDGVWAWGRAARPPSRPGRLGSHLEDAGIGLTQVLPREVLPGHSEAGAGRVQPLQPLVAAAADLAQKPVCEQHARGAPAVEQPRVRARGAGRGSGSGSGSRARGAGRGRAHLLASAAMAPSARVCVKGGAQVAMGGRRTCRHSKAAGVPSVARRSRR